MLPSDLLTDLSESALFFYGFIYLIGQCEYFSLLVIPCISLRAFCGRLFVTPSCHEPKKGKQSFTDHEQIYFCVPASRSQPNRSWWCSEMAAKIAASWNTMKSFRMYCAV